MDHSDYFYGYYSLNHISFYIWNIDVQNILQVHYKIYRQFKNFFFFVFIVKRDFNFWFFHSYYNFFKNFIDYLITIVHHYTHNFKAVFRMVTKFF